MTDGPATDESEPPVADASDGALPKDRPRGVGRRILSGFVSFGMVALIFAFLLPKLTANSSPAEVLAYLTWPRILLMTILGIVNLITNWPPISTTLPGLRLPQAGVANLSSAALSNTVPEGGAIATGLNFAMFRSWGHRLDAITSSVMTTGLWTNLVRYGLLAGALMIASTHIGWGAFWIGIVFGVLVAAALWIFVLILRSERFARRLGALLQRITARVFGWFRKEPADMVDETVKFRNEVSGLVHTRGGRLTATMVVSQLMAAFVLGVAVRSVGLDNSVISWSVIYVAFASMSLASLVAPTPGGLGVAEAALVAILSIGLPSEYDNQVLAAVLLFRMATWLLPIPLGAGAYLFWRYNKTWRRPVPAGEPTTPA